MSISLKNDAGTFSTNLNQSNPTANVNIALPTTSGTMAMTAGFPMFSAYQSVEQSLSAGTWTKINFQTEEFDLTNAYDTTTMRFTPQKAGYYTVSFYAGCKTDITFIMTKLVKNSLDIAYGIGNKQPAAFNITSSVHKILYLNGTTDFIEAYLFAEGTSPIVQNLSSVTYFQAHYIGS